MEFCRFFILIVVRYSVLTLRFAVLVESEL